MRSVFLFAVGLVTLACRGGCAPAGEIFTGSTMGTTYTVRLARSVPANEREVLSAMIESELQNVDFKMSNYRADSEVSRFNRARAREAFAVSPDTLEVFRQAMQVSELTGGAFDVTVGPLVRLWGFGPDTIFVEPPSEAALAAAKQNVGFHKLEIGDQASVIAKSAAELEVDLSAIAKGYAVDRIAEALDRKGVSSYMVEVGGEIRTRGENAEGAPWRIAIEKPLLDGREIERVVPLSGLAMATSGDYRNFHLIDGKIASHLIDPRTGRPVAHHLASVSVVDRNCMRADALASGLLVLGPEEGFDVAKREGIAALFLIRGEDGSIEERPTPAFEKLVQ